MQASALGTFFFLICSHHVFTLPRQSMPSFRSSVMEKGKPILRTGVVPSEQHPSTTAPPRPNWDSKLEQFTKAIRAREGDTGKEEKEGLLNQLRDLISSVERNFHLNITNIESNDSGQLDVTYVEREEPPKENSEVRTGAQEVQRSNATSAHSRRQVARMEARVRARFVKSSRKRAGDIERLAKNIAQIIEKKDLKKQLLPPITDEAFAYKKAKTQHYLDDAGYFDTKNRNKNNAIFVIIY